MRLSDYQSLCPVTKFCPFRYSALNRSASEDPCKPKSSKSFSLNSSIARTSRHAFMRNWIASRTVGGVNREGFLLIPLRADCHYNLFRDMEAIGAPSAVLSA